MRYSRGGYRVGTAAAAVGTAAAAAAAATGACCCCSTHGGQLREVDAMDFHEKSKKTLQKLPVKVGEKTEKSA